MNARPRIAQPGKKDSAGRCRRPLAACAARPYIRPMPSPHQPRLCAICGKPQVEQFRPFCSRRCADVDLHRWFSGVYAVPVTEDEEEDERREDGGEAAN